MLEWTASLLLGAICNIIVPFEMLGIAEGHLRGHREQ